MLLLAVFIALLTLVISFWLLWPMIIGAPFVRSNQGSIRTMLDLARIQPSDRVVDLGSGDGELLLRAIKQGAKSASGYEINPFLVWASRARIARAGLQDKIVVQNLNFWKADLSGFNVVLLFGVTHIMPALEKKLLRELPAGARVISNTFKFPRWPVSQSRDHVYLYIKTRN